MCLLLLLTAVPAATPAATELVHIEATRDTTLIEHPDGDLANGSGPVFFVGRTGQPRNGIRRGLLYFDVAGALPADAVVEDVTLTLSVSQAQGGERKLALHRVRADWSEGASSAGGGQGAPAEPGDATWLHTSYDTAYWRRPGGDFDARPSAVVPVDAPGSYAWSGTRELVRDVTLWLRVPAKNSGWILVGEETTLNSSKRFNSRENEARGSRPLLEVTFRRTGPVGGS